MYVFMFPLTLHNTIPTVCVDVPLKSLSLSLALSKLSSLNKEEDHTHTQAAFLSVHTLVQLHVWPIICLKIRSNALRTLHHALHYASYVPLLTWTSLPPDQPQHLHRRSEIFGRQRSFRYTLAMCSPLPFSGITRSGRDRGAGINRRG